MRERIELLYAMLFFVAIHVDAERRALRLQ